MGTWPTIGFTNVVDVTHNHANPRARCTNAKSVFRGTIFQSATTGPHRSSVFLRRVFRQRADYTANQSFNPDAASTGNFLLPSFGFLISSQRAAVGTAG